MIVCGWCGKSTVNSDRCTTCGHLDPARPWEQRGEAAPVISQHVPGRPALDPADIRHRLATARASLGSRPATVEAMAEALEVDARTVRRWQKVAG